MPGVILHRDRVTGTYHPPLAGSPWLRLGPRDKKIPRDAGQEMEGRVLNARRKDTVECVPATKQQAVLQTFMVARQGLLSMPPHRDSVVLRLSR